jgi:threonylcarbamoyladenosine tRNA methylthiotransferase MtaB
MGRYREGETDFTGVVAAILDLPGDFRVRISSLEPEGLGDRFIDLLSHPKMCPHLHLCLQSGSDRILLQMRRVYRLDDYLGIAKRIRERYPVFNFTTDIIVGFPGESEEDFEESCHVSEDIGFAHIHTFKYSRRDGTRAERMPDQVPERVKSERSERIRQISEQNKRSYRASLIGRTERVLVERIDEKGVASGYGEHYVPIAFDSRLAPQCRPNTFIEVSIDSLDEGEDPLLRGRPV